MTNSAFEEWAKQPHIGLPLYKSAYGYYLDVESANAYECWLACEQRYQPLLTAFRKHVMWALYTDDEGKHPISEGCMHCGSEWRHGEKEQHKDGCLAALDNKE